MTLKSLIISIFCFIFGVYGHKADFITPCTWDDQKCILSSAQHAIPFIANGVAALGVPPADPLPLKNIINIDLDGLNLNLIGLNVTGLKECQMQSISRDIKPSIISLVIDCPINAEGTYTVDGALQSIPIEGAGPCEMKTDKLRVSADIQLDVIDGSDGKKHWKIIKFEHTYDPVQKWTLSFHELYFGNKKKAEPILKILDNNWKDMILTIGKPVIKEVFQEIIRIVDKFLEAVAANHLEISS